MTALDTVAEGEEGMEGGLGGGELGELGGEDLGGDELGGEDLGADELGGEEGLGGEEASPGEETPLLATPAKRDDEDWIKVRKDGSRTTAGAKGKYYMPKKDDARHRGARTRHIKRAHTPEFATNRKVFPGLSDFASLSTGITEGEGTNYNAEEDLLLEINNEVKLLITELENKKDETETQ